MNNEPDRIVFLDYLRVIACFMVMIVHSCERFYFGADGGLAFASRGDALWATLFDSAVRASVPLFVMASSYLLFPLTKPTGSGWFYARFVRPLSNASYGAYLCHIILLCPIAAQLKPLLPTPLCIPAIATLTFFASAFASAALRRLPFAGRWLVG